MKLKKILSTLCCISSMAFMMTACEKMDPIYVDDARVNFWVLQDTFNNTGSKVYTSGYTFAAQPDHVNIDTIFLRVKTMGPITQSDRRFAAIKDTAATTNAIEGTDFKILEGLVPAGKYVGYLPVVLYRTPVLKTTTKTLGIVIADNGTFRPGVKEDMKFTIYFNDGLVMPSNWDVLTSYFGTYSEVKYKFIISVLGISDFPVSTSTYRLGQFTHYQMLDFKNRMKDALAEYNNTHPEPMRDESNVLITFP